MIQIYFQELNAVIEAARGIAAHELTFDQRAMDAGYVRGDIYFVDGSRLHVREYVSTEFGVERLTYVYHYQRADDTMIFRYDNTAHFPNLENFPHHKHDAQDNVRAANAPILRDVLQEIETLIVIE